MKLKYSTKVYLESRIDPKYKNIDLSKIDKNKKEKYYTQKNIPIKLSFTYERKRLEQYIGYTVDRNQWDISAGQVKKNVITSDGISFSEINRRINDIRSKLEDIYSKAKTNNQSISVYQLREELKKALGENKNAPNNENKIADLFDEFLNAKKNDYAYGFTKQIKTAKKYFLDFINGRKITLNEIDYSFFEKFKEYYFNKTDNSMNSFVASVKRIKYFLNYAIDNKWMTNLDYKKYKVVEKYYNKPIFLNWDEITKLYTMKIENTTLDQTRDFFIFQSMVGCRYEDLASFTINNIKITNRSKKQKNEIIILEYIDYKTKKNLQVPLNEYAIKILSKYEGKYPKLLPVFSNVKYNKYLKELGKLAELNRTIEIIDKHGEKLHIPIHDSMTTHMARRNFIGNHINKFGTPESIIKSISGHSKDSKSFSRYYEVDMEAKIRAIQGMR